MVCVACFVMPVLCWVWFQFVMPLLFKVKALLFPNSNIKEETNEEIKDNSTSPHPGIDAKSGATCPFASKTKSDQVEAKKID